MNNDDKQTLSQLMDGEWQDLDQAQSVEAACADDQLKATWSRYHLIRDVIRNDAITIDSSLTSRISAAIDEEETYTNVSPIAAASKSASAAKQEESNVVQLNGKAKSDKRASMWRTGLGGVALAACVTMATVIGLNIWQGAPDSNTGIQTVAGTTVPGQVLPEVEYVSNTGTYWVSPEAKRSANAERRLNMLLSTHIESSPTAERSGMLPYSRLVGYDSVPSE